MKHQTIVLLFILSIASCQTRKPSPTQFIATMEVKEPIEGVCDNAKIVALIPSLSSNQKEAIHDKSTEEIVADLNREVTFLKDKPDYNDKGMVNLVINCKGELVRCQIDNKTQSPELDQQIVMVFAALKKWTPGKLNNKPVDSVILYSISITNGKISIS